MVRDLLAITALELTPIHLPRPHAGVRWVATSELVDPAPFLEGGEVLLTTGLETAGWWREWPSYVERLAAVGVAAIGLAVDLTHVSAPKSLVSACRQHEMNLFEVPRQTTFVAISRATARLIEAGEQSAARAAIDLQRELTQAALREDDSASLLDRLAKSAGGAACTMTADGTLDLDPVGPRPELLDLQTVRAEITRMRPQGLRAAASVSTPGGALLVHPIGVRNRPSTYLAVAHPGRVSEVQRSAAVTAVALLSLAAERGRARRDTERRLRTRALELLVRGDERTAGLVLAAARGVGAVTFPARAAVVRATGLGDRLDDALAAVEPRYELSGLADDELVAVVRPGETSALAERLAEHSLRVGVGESVRLAELGRSSETAAHALASTTDTSPVAFWEANVNQGALSLIDPAHAAAFAKSFLAPLKGDHEDELLTTLQSFLRHHGSHVRVAEELAVHRNTVRHRVNAIEKAIGRSLQDPQTRVSAWIALQARFMR